MPTVAALQSTSHEICELKAILSYAAKQQQHQWLKLRKKKSPLFNLTVNRHPLDESSDTK